MRKKEFLLELEEYLVGIPRSEKEEIMHDYEEHFRIGKKDKRTESDIIRSLGDPKEIAREVRRELSSNKPELKSEAVEAWVAAKKFTKHVLGVATDKIASVIQRDKKKKDGLLPKIILGGIIFLVLMIVFSGWFLSLLIIVGIVFLIYNYSVKRSKRIKHAKVSKSGKSVRKRERGRTNTVRLVLCLAFNVLFFVWFWVGLLAALVGLFVASVAVSIAGGILFSFGIFAVISYGNPVINDMLFAGIFSGVGVVILGILLMSLAKMLVVSYFRITKRYIQLNNNFIKK